MHKDEWQGLDAHGFDQSLFTHIPHMIMDSSTSRQQITTMIESARANLYTVAEHAETEPSSIIRYILDIASQDYAVAVKDQKVVDEQRFQDIAGYLKVVAHWGEKIDAPEHEQITSMIDELLVAYDPSGQETVAAVSDFQAKLMRITESLSKLG